MKVARDKAGFQVVYITLESQREVDAMAMLSNYGPIGDAVETRFGVDIYTALREVRTYATTTDIAFLETSLRGRICPK